MSGPLDPPKPRPRTTSEADLTDVPATAHRRRRTRKATAPAPEAPVITVMADNPEDTFTGKDEVRSKSAKAGPIPKQPRSPSMEGAPPSGPAEAKAKPTDAKTPDAKTADTKAADTKTADPGTVGAKALAGTTGTVEVLSSKEDGTTAKEKAERPPPDWEHFAPQPIRPPTAITKVATRVRWLPRLAAHEWTLTVVGGLLLSVLLNWRALGDPARTLPQDVWDPSLIAYLIAWGGHALGLDPASLWHINAFYPSPYGLAYSDSMLGYAPAGLIGAGPEAAVLRYNVIFILAQALVFIGGYALVRQIGVGRVGAAVAAVAFAVAPWRLGQAGHLHVISTGGIVLALAMLARGHGVRWRTRFHHEAEEEARPPKRPGWALAGWLVATWQITIGFGIGLVFMYVLAGALIVSAVVWLIRSRRFSSKLLIADVVGGAVFASVALALAQPYLAVLDLFPGARRTDAWIPLYSPPLWGFLTAPEHSLAWGDLHASARAELSLPGEMALLPGFTLYALAAAGLVFSIWSIWIRLALLAGVAATIVLALGTNGPAQGRAGYLLLLHGLPGFEGLRTPGRLIIWTTLLLALLAGGAVGALVRRAGEVAQRRGLPRPTTTARWALLLPFVLVLVEGIGTTPQVPVPPAPEVLSSVQAPYLVLPSDELRDMNVMLWSTNGFPDIVNGGSGLVPDELARIREEVETFPDEASVQYLRGLGVRTVVVLLDRAAGTPWEGIADRPVDDPTITRDITDEAAIFTLTP